MKPVGEILVKPNESMLRAVEIIDRGGMQIALVVDDTGRLRGTITDGDVRRALLRGMQMDSPISQVMNTAPRTVSQSASARVAMQTMTTHGLRQVPVVAADGALVGLEYLDDLLHVERQDTWVVLMAGGQGVRLRPITQTTPKPMIPVGGRPLIEGIISSFADQGFQRFFLALNYKPEQFRAHFGDGSKMGVSVEYLEEEEPRGTAGALSLLPERPTAPVVVMNGDLLTSVRYGRLLDFHAEHEATATMCVREYQTQVPYGVVETNNDQFLGVVEKPTHSYFVNAGIYALGPDAVAAIPGDRPYNMTDLFVDLRAQSQPLSVFPVREYWLDVGRMEDLERAQVEYGQVYSS